MQDLAVHERLNRLLHDGTTHQRALSEHVLSNIRDCSFSSARELAARNDVNVASVIRFTQRLGFSRYDDFRQSLRTYYLSALEPVDLLHSQSRPDDTCKSVIQQDLRLLTQLARRVDRGALEELTSRIVGARRIVIGGFGEHGGIAVALAHLLTYLGLDVVIETRGGIYLSAYVAHLTADDLLLSFSFWRPSRDTIQAFTWCHRHGVPTAVISDSATSQVALHATHTIIVPCEAVSFFQSMSAALSIVNVLVALVAARRTDQTETALQRSRAYNREFGIVVERA